MTASGSGSSSKVKSYQSCYVTEGAEWSTNTSPPQTGTHTHTHHLPAPTSVRKLSFSEAAQEGGIILMGYIRNRTGDWGGP